MQEKLTLKLNMARKKIKDMKKEAINAKNKSNKRLKRIIQ